MLTEHFEGLPRIRRAALAGCAIAIALICLILVRSDATAADPKGMTVQLVVDYGDGVQVHFTALPWREGMTALDALSAAQAHPHGITFSQRGSGASAMIIKIGDLKNQGGGENRKNWIFYLNGKAAEVGAGSQRLKPADAVLWKFEVYHYNS